MANLKLPESNSKLKIGDSAPDVLLQTLDGQTVSLAESWQRGNNALLIFLRHLG